MPTAAAGQTTDSIADLLGSFTLYLRAKNLSPRTIALYRKAALSLDAFLMSKSAPSIETKDLERYVKSRLAQVKATTVRLEFGSLQQFFHWMVEDELITHSPMDRMTPPKVQQKATDILNKEDFQALIKATTGTSLTEVRDRALLYLFYDTGCRLSEVTGLQVGDINPEQGVMIVTGKGNKQRYVRYGNKTARALDKYIRHRAQTRHAGNPNLWVGKYGTMTSSGINQAIKYRAELAGIPNVHAHRFRHSFAHNMKAQGLSDEQIMTLGGWESPQMLHHYGKSLKVKRAMEAYVSPVD